MPVKAITFASPVGLRMKSTVRTSKARRCLFGRPDHDELRKDLDDQLKAASSCFKSTWNFNLETDEPVEGRYEWEAVSAAEVPTFYVKDCRRKLLARRRLCPEECVSKTTEITSSQTTPPASSDRFTPASTAFESEEDRIENLRRENETTPEGRIALATRQTRIGNYMQVKKRRLSDEELIPATPRKMPRL